MRVIRTIISDTIYVQHVKQINHQLLPHCHPSPLPATSIRSHDKRLYLHLFSVYRVLFSNFPIAKRSACGTKLFRKFSFSLFPLQARRSFLLLQTLTILCQILSISNALRNCSHFFMSCFVNSLRNDPIEILPWEIGREVRSGDWLRSREELPGWLRFVEKVSLYQHISSRTMSCIFRYTVVWIANFNVTEQRIVGMREKGIRYTCGWHTTGKDWSFGHSEPLTFLLFFLPSAYFTSLSKVVF